MPEKYDPIILPSQNDYLDYFQPGTVRPEEDPRDYTTAAHPLPLPTEPLPAFFQLPARPVQNQGQRGACAAFGVGRTLTRAVSLQTAPATYLDVSEEALYAEGRARINLTCQDGGSDPRINAAICCELGLPSEAAIPYLSRDLCWRPDAGLWSQRIVQGEKYVSLRTRDDVRTALYAGHEPTICLTLYRNFAPDAAGILPMPSGAVWGGHCMTFVGWDFRNRKKYWIIENQWGSGWGNGGRAYLPDAYWDLHESQGGVWATTGTWVIYVPQAPPPPKRDTFYIQVWRQTPTGWDVGTPIEQEIGAYVTVKRTRNGVEETVIDFQPVF